MKWIIAAVVALVLAGGGYYFWSEMQKVESTDDAEIDGSIFAISSRIPGNVVEVAVEDQQYVNKGDVLVRLDPKDYEVAVARVKANIAEAQAGLESSRTDVPLATATTGSALDSAKSIRQEGMWMSQNLPTEM